MGVFYRKLFNPFPHNKILDQTKLKAFADDKLNVTKMIISVIERSRKHCGKSRNCLYKQFLLFPQSFQKASFPEASKGVIVWEWVKKVLESSNTVNDKTVINKQQNTNNHAGRINNRF